MGFERATMPSHEVGLQVDGLRFLGKVDIKIPVRSDGKYLGSLHISKGSIDWVEDRSTVYARHSLSWEAFAKMMEQLPPKPLKTSGRRAPRKQRGGD